MTNTRTIYYIDSEEDTLDIEVDLSLQRSMEENLILFCEHIAANFAMMGIDVMNYQVEKNIYYIENEQ